MKAISLLLWAFLLFFFALPVFAQEPELPEHFIWVGAGADRLEAALPNGIVGYGYKIGDSQYLASNMVMTSENSTLSGDFIQVVAQQDPVTLFILGELGVESGRNVTNLQLGGGVGFEMSFSLFSGRLKRWGLIGIMKVLKDNDSDLPNAVKPRFAGGLVYKFGKQ